MGNAPATRRAGLRDSWRASFALLALALLLAGVLTRSWWIVRVEGQRSFIGITSAEICSAEVCTTYSYPEVLPDRDQSWVYTGRITFGLACASSAFLAFGALLSLLRRRLPGPVSPARIAIVLCVATGFAASYLFANPMGELAEMERAVVAGKSTASLVVPGVRKDGVPACPQCRAPTRFVAQYARHFCESCRYYL